MSETSARLIRLLGLLQARRDWTGGVLAERLGVSARTVRRDVDRLRDIGYPIDAVGGVGGGYRLGSHAEVPPLLLDDDEAVAVALGLRAAAGVAGIAEASVRALAKLDVVLPSRLRHKVADLSAVVVDAPTGGVAADPSTLIAIAACVRDRQRVRFDYAGTPTEAEPYRLAHSGGRWFLLAWDGGWRAFRVDRMVPRVPAGGRFTERAVPDGFWREFADGLGRS